MDQNPKHQHYCLQSALFFPGLISRYLWPTPPTTRESDHESNCFDRINQFRAKLLTVNKTHNL